MNPYLGWTVHIGDDFELYEAATSETSGYTIVPTYDRRGFRPTYHDASDPEGNAIAWPAATVAEAKAIAPRHHRCRLADIEHKLKMAARF